MESLDGLKQLVANGQLSEALGAAKKLVTQGPLDSGARATLCALLFASGEPARAVQQFQAYQQLGGENLPAGFAAVLECYEKRSDVLAGKCPPTLAGDPPDWLDGHLKALAALSGGDSQPLVDSLEGLADSLLQLKGETEAIEFTGFRNADARLAPVFEGVFDGEYTWLPLEQVMQVMLPARPELIQDLIAVPCMVAMKGGWRRQGHLFVSYPGSEKSESEKVKLSMETAWDESIEEIDIGLGQQIFFAGEDAVPLFSIGSCRFS